MNLTSSLRTWLTSLASTAQCRGSIGLLLWCCLALLPALPSHASSLPCVASAHSLHMSHPSADDEWQPHRTYATPLHRLRALTWNVENLFDTLHDEGCHDEEFLPSADRHWNSPRYWRKQGAIARTLVAAADQQPIDLVALCEVENDSVVHDLCRRTRLARLGYEYLITHSSDLRGVDVALLFQPTTLALLSHCSYRIPHDALHERPTRDLLLATFRLPQGDTLDVVVAHLPSRLGGVSHTAPYRLRAASLIAHLADSLQQQRLRPQLIVMGDFNDEPSDATISQVLAPYVTALTPFAKVQSAAPPPTRLPRTASARTTTTAPTSSAVAAHCAADTSALSSITGTYFFRHQWSRIDQILVSPSLLSANAPLFTRPDCDVHLFAPSFLLETNAAGEPHPRRTFLGTYYHGGVSDHLPLFVDYWY